MLPSPNPKSAVMVFWDYDTQWGAERSRSPGGKKNWGPLEFPNTDRLLEIHAEYQIPACFAVVGAAALAGERPYHDAAQIRRIHAAGHEIASHSHRHEWLPDLGMAQLRETLASSKDALEECIGEQVVSFVPPYNQPFDYPAACSFSLSERRQCGPGRINIVALCEALQATGYRFCRVAYRSAWQRMIEWLLRRQLHLGCRAEWIRKTLCVRVSVCGFAEAAHGLLNKCRERRGLIVVYGHPHSLAAENSQNERYLRPFLSRVKEMKEAGLIDVLLPRDLLQNGRDL